MTTPHEDLILKLRGQAYTTCRPDQLCDQAADLLQSQAERIAELEACCKTAGTQLTAWQTVIDEKTTEIYTLRAELAALAATEPVATINDLSNARMFTMEANGYSRKDKLFTHPMPAQDVVELVEAFEHHIEQTRPIERSTIALSRYKGAK